MFKRRIKAADLFCGAGGSSTGLMQAVERSGHKLDLLAVNHWQRAVETHAANHPGANHLCHDLDNIDPKKATGGKLDLLIASPECTHHSVARGGMPMNDQSRATAWHVVRWAEALRPSAILVENVREFQTWGPIGANGRPLKSRRGETFQAWVQALRSIGYNVGFRLLNAADFGAATTRTRLFVVAVRGRRPIPWPDQTHTARNDETLFGRLKPWRPAREIIDWSIRGKSIFGRKRPLSANTIKRIEAGLRKFGGKAAEPFLLMLTHGGRLHGVDSPLPTVTTAHRGEIGLVEPFLTVLRRNGNGRSVEEPCPTVCAGGEHVGLCEPFLVRYHGNHAGKTDGENRNHSTDLPLPALDTSNRYGLCEPFVISAGGPRGKGRNPHSVNEPLPTVIAENHAALVEPFILPHRQFEQMDVDSVDRPLRTVTAQNGGNNALVEPFVVKYNGTGGAHPVSDPLDTISTRDRFGLVEPQHIYLDILFRMLQPHELAAAMSFPSDYKFSGNRSEVVRQIGNAVDVRQAEALLSAILAA